MVETAVGEESTGRGEGKGSVGNVTLASTKHACMYKCACVCT